jgi:glycosyltransferase involved in cell wall biosynthesis
MKILLCSVPFRPSVGGIETVSRVLAERFAALRHEVVLITRTPGADADRQCDAAQPYAIVRRPDAAALLNWMRWSDVVFHNNISLRWAWALPIVRRPWVVAHHVWLPRRGAGALAGRLKRLALRFAHNVAASRALADDLPVPCDVIPNPYAQDVFRRLSGKARSPGLLYAGRLVSDKGVDLLLDALAELQQRGLALTLTVAGDGPLAASLRADAQRLGLADRVHFVGARAPDELAALMNSHRFLVVPSRWEEPFGLVAIEGLACGMVPVVARSGGLPEAVGDCGIVFGKGNSRALADQLEHLARQPMRPVDELASARHLAQHRPDEVALRYLGVMQRALGFGASRARA